MFKTPKQRAQHSRWALAQLARQLEMRPDSRAARSRRVMALVHLHDAGHLPSDIGSAEMRRWIAHAGPYPRLVRQVLEKIPLGKAFL